MGERMTSPEEARDLKRAIDAFVGELEDDGFSMSQIGAALTGIGLALTQRADGRAQAVSNLDAVRRALIAELEKEPTDAR